MLRWVCFIFVTDCLDSLGIQDKAIYFDHTLVFYSLLHTGKKERALMFLLKAKKANLVEPQSRFLFVRTKLLKDAYDVGASVL